MLNSREIYFGMAGRAFMFDATWRLSGVVFLLNFMEVVRIFDDDYVGDDHGQ